MDNLGIEFITVFGLPPVQQVELAADLGCRYITTVLQPIDYNPHGYPKYSLKEDRAMRRDLIAALRDNNVSLSMGEGFAVFPDSDVRETSAADLDIMCELGIKRVNSVSFEPDVKRSFDQLGALAEMAGTRDIELMIEFVPTFGIADLPTAVAAVRHVGRGNFRLLIDTMHFARSGARPADVAALDPAMIGYIQFCDALKKPKIPNYMEEAMYERMVPGTGELPLRDILAALPRDRVIGLEVPMRSKADAGVGPRERVASCIEGARKILSEVEAAA
jgi:sugar phosphate isomerase/epimerase